MRVLKQASVLLVLGLPVTAAAEQYTIQLTRPAKVGQKYQISARCHRSVSGTAWADWEDGKPAKTTAKEFRIELNADVTVLDVDKSHQPAKRSLRINNFTITEGGAGKALLPKGTVVTASVQEGAEHFEVGGRPVPDDARVELEFLVALPPRRTTADEMFGADDPKTMGERWNINAEAAAKGAFPKHIKVDGQHVSGTVTLKDVVTVGHTECLQVALDMTAERVIPPLPKGLALERATLRSRRVVLLPVDASLGPRKRWGETILEVRSQGKPVPALPEMLIESTIKQTFTVDYSYQP